MTTDYEVKVWTEEQRICDLADTLLKILVEKQITARDSVGVLQKAKSTLEQSIYSATWGQPLVCESAPNRFFGDHEKVIAEIERRKVQNTVQKGASPNQKFALNELKHFLNEKESLDDVDIQQLTSLLDGCRRLLSISK
jgi:hypothetical protein